MATWVAPEDGMIANVTVCIRKVTAYVDERSPDDVLYLDFSKAIDRNQESGNVYLSQNT